MFGFQSFGRRFVQTASKNYTTYTKYSYSQNLAMNNMQTSTMISRCTPIPSLTLMNIMNLRELLEKCKEESDVEPNSSIALCDIVVSGNIVSLRTVPSSSLVNIIADIVGISMCALTKNTGTISTRLSRPPRQRSNDIKL